jgi:hypothetical protein
LLEYYSLVREGKTNYVATSAFLGCFGHRGQELSEFFKVYAVRCLCRIRNELCSPVCSQGEFKPKRRQVKSKA